MHFCIVTDGEAKLSGLTPVLPVHLRCVQACCRIVRGLDGSTVLRVVLPLLSDEGCFQCQHSRLMLLFAITHNPQSIHSKASVVFTHPRDSSEACASEKKKLDGWGAICWNI